MQNESSGSEREVVIDGAGRIDASALIDAQPIGRTQLSVFTLAFLIAAFDGLDLQVISFVSLDMAREWNISRASLGAVFSTGLFGMMLGGLSLGTLGDVFGQRRVLIALTVLLGLLTVATGFTTSMGQLYVLRFLTGLCVGGALPNTVALLSQYAPKRRRAQLISVVGVGIPLGAATGGVLAALLLPELDWRWLFYVAGGLALTFCPVLLTSLPETIPSMLKRADGQHQALTMLRSMYPRVVIPQGEVIWGDVSAKRQLPVVQLFDGGRVYMTVLLWSVFVASLMNVYLLPSWLPALLQDAQVPPAKAALATSGFSVAGMLGAVSIGWLVDRFGFVRVLCTGYILSAIGIAAVALSHSSLAVLATTVFLSGFFVVGCQGALNAVPSILYPADVRSTATGWALGIGRLGAIVGPLLAGILLSAGWAHSQVLLGAALVGVLASLLVLILAVARASTSTDR
ncbi:MFS transporter [Steroidobacter sp.]|uniref:MFS transporter n=1 Tax=Steroidobacter sp. TaxID=1978227 RepID=UPI001A617EB6|nr:MFS transporter [Steroidobacter sp.]MBL8266427.1 MFS transporter [Steroidobacter sp.]